MTTPEPTIICCERCRVINNYDHVKHAVPTCGLCRICGDYPHVGYRWEHIIPDHREGMGLVAMIIFAFGALIGVICVIAKTKGAGI